ncbi:hypothetical protein BDZ89DRAFT_1068050 [Hymenopellis radicata]|nr:hypothetical protein BDZ89DRAFT_1068050 [Hymenopellis radicata]
MFALHLMQKITGATSNEQPDASKHEPSADPIMEPETASGSELPTPLLKEQDTSIATKLDAERGVRMTLDAARPELDMNREPTPIVLYDSSSDDELAICSTSAQSSNHLPPKLSTRIKRDNYGPNHAWNQSDGTRRDEHSGHEMRKRRHNPLSHRPEPQSREKERLMGGVSEVHRQNQMLQRELDDAKASLSRARAALEHEQNSRREDRHLSDTRARELEHAQTYLTKADQLSCADVKEILDGLNDEMVQVSSTLTDLFLDSVVEHAISRTSPTYLEAERNVISLIGEQFAHLLRTSNESKGEVLQTALQASMTRLCDDFLQHWVLGDAPYNQGLKDLYARIRESNVVAIAGRWRALTRSCSKYRCGTESPKRIFVHALLPRLWNILQVAGWSLEHGEEMIRERYSERVEVMAERLIKLDRAMNEGITSQEVAVAHTSTGDLYISELMRTEGNDNMVDDEQRVACTTALGLHTRTVIDGNMNETELNIILKPTVLLFSELMSL